ncbi:11725_t:CDS:1, partial [Entrophospora sp. SA101]
PKGGGGSSVPPSMSGGMPDGDDGGSGGFDPSSLIGGSNPKSGGNGGFDLGNALVPFTGGGGGQPTASPSPNTQEGDSGQSPAASGNKSLANSPQSKVPPPSTGSSNEAPVGAGK